MENKINIAELLKDCPKGMELDCLVFEDVTLYKIDTDIENEFPIRIKTKNDYFLDLTKYGTYSNVEEAKCVIFPKGKTTWDGFTPSCQFKDGDIVFYDNCVSIFKEWGDETLFRNYVKVDIDGIYPMLCDRTHSNGKGIKREARFATEEEKQKLFQAIKDNGYKWNAETKTLEKLLKFKVGDRVKHISAYASGIVVEVTDKGYHIEYPKAGGFCYIGFELEKDYELVPNKFDITTLKEFDSRVLVRMDNCDLWRPALFGFVDKSSGVFYVLGGNSYSQCIPYDRNEHLRGTTNDCDDFYKTWE